MDPAAKIALHHRLVDGFMDCFLNAAQRRRTVFPEEWIPADDLVVVSPQMGGGAEFPAGQMYRDLGLSVTDHMTMEWGMYWKHMPDFGALGREHGRTVDENGFSFWWAIGGTLSDGTRLEMIEVDFLRTNDDGHLTRWEVIFDWAQTGPILELVAGLPATNASWEDYANAIPAFLPEAEQYIAPESLAAWRALPIFAALGGQ